MTNVSQSVGWWESVAIMSRFSILFLTLFCLKCSFSTRSLELQKQLDYLLTTSLYGDGQRPSGRKAKTVEVPEFLREQLLKSQNLQSFSQAGVPSGANTLRSVPGKVSHNSQHGKSLLDFSSEKSKDHLLLGIINSNEETVVAAELKVFWLPQLKKKRSKGTFHMTVYDVTRKGTGGDISVPMDTRKVYHRDADLDSGWYTFNVFPAIKRWAMRDPRNKKKLRHYLSLEMSGMKVKLAQGKTRSLLPAGNITSAYLVIYSDDLIQTRLKREAGVGRKRKRRPNRRRRLKSESGKRREKQLCQVHPYYVDFADIGWSDWIFSPVGYDVNFCAGICPYPMADHMNATNHAVFQQFAHRTKRKVPPPCCVPTEFVPLNVLYIEDRILELAGTNSTEEKTRDATDRDVVKLKFYSDMTVTSCGCR